jgi:hypothetical protein
LASSPCPYDGPRVTTSARHARGAPGNPEPPAAPADSYGIREYTEPMLLAPPKYVVPKNVFFAPRKRVP